MYNAYVTTLTNLRKHSNADRLQCTTLFGNNIIVDNNVQKIPENMQPNLSANNNYNNNIPQFNQQQNIFLLCHIYNYKK